MPIEKHWSRKLMLLSPATGNRTRIRNEFSKDLGIQQALASWVTQQTPSFRGTEDAHTPQARTARSPPSGCVAGKEKANSCPEGASEEGKEPLNVRH